MKKQIISFSLVIVLVLSVITATAFAGELENNAPIEILEEEIILQETEAVDESEAPISDNIEEAEEATETKMPKGPIYTYEKTANADGTETRTEVATLADEVPGPMGIKISDKDVGKVFNRLKIKIWRS